MATDKKLFEKNNSLEDMIKKILQEFFLVSLTVFFVFFILELVKAGIISNHFDLNIILIIILLTGIGWVFLKIFDKNSL